MNIFLKFLVMHDLVSSKTKKDLGFEILCKVEKFLPLSIEHAEERQVATFKTVVLKTLSQAEQICLKAHLEEMIEIYTIGASNTYSEKAYYDKHRHTYEMYLEALSSIM